MDKPGKVPRYWTGAHTTQRLRFHLVLVPKYRKRVLTGALAARLEELLYQACEVNGWELHELSILPDPVHLLVQFTPKESVASVVQRLKGGTSRQIRLEFPDLVEFLWGASLWAAGYFAETVGKVDEATLRSYIREQPMPPDAPQAG
jgi:putative transposase